METQSDSCQTGWETCDKEGEEGRDVDFIIAQN